MRLPREIHSTCSRLIERFAGERHSPRTPRPTRESLFRAEKSVDTRILYIYCGGGVMSGGMDVSSADKGGESMRDGCIVRCRRNFGTYPGYPRLRARGKLARSTCPLGALHQPNKARTCKPRPLYITPISAAECASVEPRGKALPSRARNVCARTATLVPA